MKDDETPVKIVEAELAKLAEQVTESRIAHLALVEQRDELVIRLYDTGRSQADIARVAGITYQQVHQIVRKRG